MDFIDVAFSKKPTGLERLVSSFGFTRSGSKLHSNEFKDFSQPSKKPPFLLYDFGLTVQNYSTNDDEFDPTIAVLRIHLNQKNAQQVKLVYNLLRVILSKYDVIVNDEYMDDLITTNDIFY